MIPSNASFQTGRGTLHQIRFSCEVANDYDELKVTHFLFLRRPLRISLSNQEDDANSCGRRGNSLRIGARELPVRLHAFHHAGEGYAETLDCFNDVWCHRAGWHLHACDGRRCELRSIESVLCAEYPALPCASLRQN